MFLSNSMQAYMDMMRSVYNFMHNSMRDREVTTVLPVKIVFGKSYSVDWCC